MRRAGVLCAQGWHWQLSHVVADEDVLVNKYRGEITWQAAAEHSYNARGMVSTRAEGQT
jgi:hypothetical protein